MSERHLRELFGIKMNANTTLYTYIMVRLIREKEREADVFTVLIMMNHLCAFKRSFSDVYRIDFDPGCHPRPWLGSRGVIDAPESEGVKPEAVPTQNELSPGRRRGGWGVCVWRVMETGMRRTRGWYCSLEARPEKGDSTGARVMAARLRLTPTLLWHDPQISTVNGHQCVCADMETTLT